MRKTLVAIIGALFLGCASHHTPFVTENTVSLEQRVLPDPAVEKKYAVLLNGDDSHLHNYNISHAYDALKNNAFMDEDIFILSPQSPRKTDSVCWNDQPTDDNIILVFKHLANIADTNDFIIIYTTGHGSFKDESYLSLPETDMPASIFKQMTDYLHAKTVIVMDQCYSGGFATRYENCTHPRLVITDSDDNHETFCKEFSFTFWNALSDSSAEENCDRMRSLYNAYEKALAIHKKTVKDSSWTNGQYVLCGHDTLFSLR